MFLKPQAPAVALKAFPGKITDEELEKEKGGSGLRYSFDIKNGGVTHEVGVDAKTAKLLDRQLQYYFNTIIRTATGTGAITGL